MYEELKRKVKKKLKKKLKRERYEHTLRVASMCQALAMCYRYDLDKAELAGLLHDCARVYDNETLYWKCEEHGVALTEYERANPLLLHAIYGEYLAREKYGVKDQEILDAIRYHTTGRPEMSTLEKIVFIADYIEPGRYKAENLTEIRQTAFLNLDLTMNLILRDTLKYLESQEGQTIDPMTREAYRYYPGLIELEKDETNREVKE